MSVLAPVATFLVLGAAAVLAGVGSLVKRWMVDAFSIGISAAACWIGVALLRQTSTHRVIHWFAGWRPHHGISLGVGFTVDTIGAGTVVLVAALAVAAFLYSWRYLESGERHFHVLMLIFVGSMIGFALAGDLFLLFVFFEAMSVAAYALTGMEISKEGPLEGAMNFAIVNSVASFALLGGIGLIYARTGALNFAQAGQAIAHAGAQPVVVLSLVLILSGLLTKAAVVPFHFWLDDAHAVAPTPVCILFSGIMVELGIYAAARVYWTVYSGALALNQHSIGLVLIGGGVASIGVGSLMCFLQQHIKRLLAFSTIAHAGIAVVGLGLMSHEALAGAAVYVAGHGLVKASLFVLAGVLLHRFSSLDDEYLRGRARGMPFVGVLFAIGGLALAGLPPFGMEAGKALIEEAGKQYSWLPWVLGFAGAMTGAAVLRVAGRVFVGWGPKSRRLFASKAYATGVEGRETTSHFDRTPFVLVFPAVALLLAGLAVGLIPHLEEHAAVAAARFVDRIGYARAVLASSDHLVTPVTHKTSFSAVIYALAASAAAVGLAGAALARESIARPVRSLLRPVAIPILALRRAHSGHVGDYVMWYTVGLAAMGGLFFIAVR